MKEIKENEAVQQRADVGCITVRTAFVSWLHKKKFVHDGHFKLSLSLSFLSSLSSLPDYYTSEKVEIHLHRSEVKDAM